MSDGVSFGSHSSDLQQPLKGLPPVVNDSQGRPPWDYERMMEAPVDDFYITGKQPDMSHGDSHDKSTMQKIGDWFKKAWNFILKGPNGQNDGNGH